MLKGLRKFSSFSQPSRGALPATTTTTPTITITNNGAQIGGASSTSSSTASTSPKIKRRQRSLSPSDQLPRNRLSREYSDIVKRVIARHDYNPVNVDTDLALVRGVEYDILDSTGVWWMARDPETGEIGLIPFNYVEQILCDDSDDVPELKCSILESDSSASTLSSTNSAASDNDSTDVSRPFVSHVPSIPPVVISAHNPWNLEPAQFTLKNSWYQPAVDREMAEKILYGCNRNGAFLIRPSTSETRCFTLSLLHKTDKSCSVKHYLIQQCPTTARFYIRQSEEFESLDKLIAHYRQNRGHLATSLTTIPKPSSINHLPQPRLHRSNSKLETSNIITASASATTVSKSARSKILSSTTAAITLGSKDKSWEIKASELQLLEELGSGQFGVVRHGKWRSRTDVAVKLMKEGTMSEEDFIDEAKVMTRLQHPNLVKLYGLCIEHRPICIVAEYLKHGSLLSFLRKNDSKLNLTTASSKVALILLNMSSQVCAAMAYLEARNYIHRDLAARNCLVGHGGVVKVADFGLARYVIDDEYTSSGGTKFPIRWAPPEVLWYTRFSSKSDVWAYGILMWEVYTCGRLPYGKLSNAEVVEQIRQGARLERPNSPNCSTDMYQLMHVCWQESPEQRPSFQRISSYLSALRSKEIAKKH